MTNPERYGVKPEEWEAMDKRFSFLDSPVGAGGEWSWRPVMRAMMRRIEAMESQHAAAVEAAFREAHAAAQDYTSMPDEAWRLSDARRRLEEREPVQFVPHLGEVIVGDGVRISTEGDTTRIDVADEFIEQIRDTFGGGGEPIGEHVPDVGPWVAADPSDNIAVVNMKEGTITYNVPRGMDLARCRFLHGDVPCVLVPVSVARDVDMVARWAELGFEGTGDDPYMESVGAALRRITAALPLVPDMSGNPGTLPGEGE